MDSQTHIDWASLFNVLLSSGLLLAIVQWIRARLQGTAYYRAAVAITTPIEIASKSAEHSKENPLPMKAPQSATATIGIAATHKAVEAGTAPTASQAVQGIKDTVKAAEAVLPPKEVEAIHQAVEQARVNAATKAAQQSPLPGIINLLGGIVKTILSVKALGILLALGLTLAACTTTTSTTTRVNPDGTTTTTVTKTQAADPQSVALLEAALKDALATYQDYKAQEEAAKAAGDTAKQEAMQGKIATAQSVLQMALRAYETYQAAHPVGP